MSERTGTASRLQGGGIASTTDFAGTMYVSDRTRYVIRQLLTRPTSVIGFTLVLSFTIVSLAAPLLAPPENPNQPFIMPRDGYRSEPELPSSGHVLGTTEGQYDVYYGVIWGTRTAFRIGFMVVNNRSRRDSFPPGRWA